MMRDLIRFRWPEPVNTGRLDTVAGSATYYCQHLLVFAVHNTERMKYLIISALSLCGALALLSQNTQDPRFHHNGHVNKENNVPSGNPQEAVTGFDNVSNGFLPQGIAFDHISATNVHPNRSFNDNRFLFEEVETAAEGLGPTYNATSCAECHQNVATGGASQVTEHRTGRKNNGVFFESLGGSLIHSRATHPDIVEHVALDDDIRTFRISTNTLGDGYVEAIANETLQAIRDAQPESMRGTAILVPVLEGDGSARVGRFGWKSQHASLKSFSADAYLNEMGITSPLFPQENTSSGKYVGFGTSLIHGRNPKTAAMTCRRSRTSCGRPRHRPAAKSQATSQQARQCFSKFSAASATRQRL
jgi:hypothetical protein